MKRKGHLYEAIYDFNNIVDAYMGISSTGRRSSADLETPISVRWQIISRLAVTSRKIQ